jgi:uncharacterized membrane protein
LPAMIGCFIDHFHLLKYIYIVFWAKQYVELLSIWNYKVFGAFKYLELKSIWSLKVFGALKYL